MALENKLGLTSSADLAREEERISKKKAVWLFESGTLDKLPVGTFASLKAIHKYLFDDIYDFAGELRTVNLAKGNFRFAPLMYLEAALTNIDASISMACSAMELLDGRRDRELLSNILYFGLPAVLHAVAEGTFRKAGNRRKT